MKENAVDVVFSFDTTGSMYPCLTEVRSKVAEMVNDLFNTVKDLRIGVIAHGDYCDARSTYVTKVLDLTDDRASLVNFVKTVGATGGGDFPECYELVLHQSRSLAWNAKRERILVMIGDATPHEGRDNESGYDWKNEVALLNEIGVRIFAVQCLNNYQSTSFYKTMAQDTGGLHLPLNQFRWINDLIMGIVYKSDENPEIFENYEANLRKYNRFNDQQNYLFDTIAGRETKPIFDYSTPSRGGTAVAIKPADIDLARFQSFVVHGTPSIREFVESRGIKFKKGQGFYPHVSRPETIQARKEIILENLKTGEFITGVKAREMLGIPYGREVRLPQNPLPGYKCWVQSTSVNRVLREAEFMYEVID